MRMNRLVSHVFYYSAVRRNRCRHGCLSHDLTFPSSMIPVKSASFARCTYRSGHVLVRMNVRKFHARSGEPIIHVERADIYQFGSVQRSEAIFKDLSWKVESGEAWAIVCNSNATRGEIFQVQSCHWVCDDSLTYIHRCC